MYTDLSDPIVANWIIEMTTTDLDPCTCHPRTCSSFPSHAAPGCLYTPSVCTWEGREVDPDRVTCKAHVKDDGSECPKEQVSERDTDIPWPLRDPAVDGICLRGRCKDRCGFWGPRQECEFFYDIDYRECKDVPVGIDFEQERENENCDRFRQDCDNLPSPYLYDKVCEYVKYVFCAQEREFHEVSLPGIDRTGCPRNEGDILQRGCTCPPDVVMAAGGRVLEPDMLPGADI